MLNYYLNVLIILNKTKIFNVVFLYKLTNYNVFYLYETSYTTIYTQKRLFHAPLLNLRFRKSYF